MRNQIVLAAIALSAFPLSAASTALELLPPVTGGGSNGSLWTLGWSFSVSNPVSVVSLGVYDHNLDGLSESHAIGLWDINGNLLASATVIAGGGVLDNFFRFTSIDPLTLGIGDYVIGATMGFESYVPFSDPVNFTTAPSINYLSDRFFEGAGLNFPTDQSGNIGWFGGNFQITDVASPVPEPGTSFGMLVLLCSGFAVRRRGR